ncbi:MAG: hypothetical protein WB952_17500 [Terriglobales bacterium]
MRRVRSVLWYGWSDAGHREFVGLHLRAVWHPLSTLWAMMNDPARAVLWAALQTALLVLSAILIGLYLIETRRLRIAAQQQVEASFRPAVVAVHDGSIEKGPSLVNIGNGPAIEVEWHLLNSSLKGDFPYLEPGCKPQELGTNGMKGLYNAGIGGKTEEARIECTYRSLSGWRYSSSNSYNLVHYKFATTFRDEGLPGKAGS